MSDIFSNKYFLSTAGIIIAGVIYYGYQTSNTADIATTTVDATATPSTTAATVSIDGDGTTATLEGTTTNTIDTTTTGN